MEQWGTLKNCWLVINYSVEHEKGKSPPGLGKKLFMRNGFLV